MRLHIIRTCACGHGRGAHEHYRRGTDCSSCDSCRAWHGRVSVSLRAVADDERAAAPVDEPVTVEVGVLDTTVVSAGLEPAPVVALEEGTVDAELLDDVLAAASAADGAVDDTDVEQVSADLRLGAA